MLNDVLGNLIFGLELILSWEAFYFIFIGALAGIVVGILPGIGPTAGMALLLPIVFQQDPLLALAMLTAVYYGSLYGATVTAIMLNIPGTAGVVASTFDGYPMAKNGRLGQALVIQAVSSFIGGTIGAVAVSALVAILAGFTTAFGPSEFFLVIAVALLLLVLMMQGESLPKGLVAILFGLALATVGIDRGSANTRFMFGQAELMNGIDFVPVAIGLFGVSELLAAVRQGMHRRGEEDILTTRGFGMAQMMPSRDEWRRTLPATLRGTGIGFGIGILPGAGGAIASLMAYGAEKGVAKDKSRFGKGAVEGLAGPEGANNAASAGAMIPMLSLGIPGSAPLAVLLGALVVWGLNPGPLFMTEQPEIGYGLIASMYVGNLMLVVLGLALIPVFTMVLRVPYTIVVPAVIGLSVVGTFAATSSRIQVGIMLALGVVGYWMRENGYPRALTVIAFVLGPLAERTLRSALQAARGDVMVFWDRPIARVLLLITATFVVLLVVSMTRSALRARRTAGA